MERPFTWKKSLTKILISLLNNSQMQHNYNEAFREGDLVSFGGKFTIDDQKLLVSVSIFCLYVIIIDFKINYTYFFSSC